MIEQESVPAPSHRLDALQAWLVLMPAMLWAFPGTAVLFLGDLYPELTATGTTALCALAAVGVAAVRGAARPSTLVTLWLAFVAVGVLALQIERPSDTLETSRAMLHALNGLAFLVCGASSGSRGRAWLVRGAVVVSLLLVVSALAGLQPRLSGALGNTGALSEAALPGAMCGLLLLVTCEGAWRWVGAVAASLYLFYVGAAPVIAGQVAFVIALLAAFAGLRPRVRWPAGVAVAFAVVALIVAGRWWARYDMAKAELSTATPAWMTDVGGFEVRARIWPGAVELWREHLWLGTGLGQFRASFPPYRDLREIAASKRAGGGQFETEVEHAHNDWLEGLVEGGLIGGALWIAFLLASGWHAWRATRSGVVELACLGAGVIALLADALVRAPLTFNPVAASLYFAFAGAISAREAGDAPRGLARGMPILIAALLAIQAPRARAFVRHGLALRAPDHVNPAAALEACPDSALALALAARTAELRAQTHDSARELWTRLIALRPHQFEALMELGTLRALGGDASGAHEVWTHALALEENHRALAENIALLEVRNGSLDAARAALSRAARLDGASREWRVQQGAEELLAGNEQGGVLLLQTVEPAIGDANGEILFARAKELRDQGAAERLADALEMQAHTVWAREHVAAGDLASAVRSYRQALRLSSSVAPRGAARLRLELAAALAIDHREDQARKELEGLVPSARDREGLPEWARAALRAAGLFAD